MAEPIWSVSAGVHYYDNYAFLRKSEACILLVVDIFIENIGMWFCPQYDCVDAWIREPKPPKVHGYLLDCRSTLFAAFFSAARPSAGRNLSITMR